MTTTQPHSIPAEGLRHQAGTVVITATQHPQAGCLIQVRVDDTIARHLCSQHNTPSAAIAAYNTLVAQHPAAVEAPVVRLEPAAKGTQTYMSPAEIAAITEAPAGVIRQRRVDR